MPTYTWVPSIIPNAEPNTLRRENDDGSVSFIPNDPANTDYQEFLRLEEAAKQAPPKYRRRRS